jgi:hypothetical protein
VRGGDKKGKVGKFHIYTDFKKIAISVKLPLFLNIAK